MPNLRHILKYAPAVVLGLLVVAWVVSVTIPSRKTWMASDGDTTYSFAVLYGAIDLYANKYPGGNDLGISIWETAARPASFRSGTLGELEWTNDDTNSPYDSRYLLSPLPGWITALIPLAIGPFIAFRFRLWQYLAYTALIAIELAYYLRWQE